MDWSFLGGGDNEPASSSTAPTTGKSGSGFGDLLSDTLSRGISRDGRKLQPPMGFSYYAKLSPSDLDAIVAYLRTLPPQPR